MQRGNIEGWRQKQREDKFDRGRWCQLISNLTQNVDRILQSRWKMHLDFFLVRRVAVALELCVTSSSTFIRVCLINLIMRPAVCFVTLSCGVAHAQRNRTLTEEQLWRDTGKMAKVRTFVSTEKTRKEFHLLVGSLTRILSTSTCAILFWCARVRPKSVKFNCVTVYYTVFQKPPPSRESGIEWIRWTSNKSAQKLWKISGIRSYILR